MMIAAVAALCCSTQPHPDMQKILEDSKWEAFDAIYEMDPLEAQKAIDSFVSPPGDVVISEVRDLTIKGSQADIPCRLYHPDPETHLPLVVWFHGGGWTWGSLESTDMLCRFISAEAGVAVLSVEYRRAPQHRFPAAVIDCIDSVRWAALHSEELIVDTNRLAVAGASAGGNLAAVVSAAATEGGPSIAAQFLLYPALDALADTESMRTYATGYFLETKSMEWFYDIYAPDRSQWGDPRLSPLRGETFAGLPASIIMPAQCDPLRDEAVQYAVRLIDAGVPVDLLVADGMIHGFGSFSANSTAAQDALRSGVRRLAWLLHGSHVPSLQLLDINMDGVLEPFEAADAILRTQEAFESDVVRVDDLVRSALMAPASQRQELNDIWHDLNTDGDAYLVATEIDESMWPLLSERDLNEDDRISRDEYEGIMQLEGELFTEMEAAAIRSESDTDRDGRISRAEAFDDPELHAEADEDRDGFVEHDELMVILSEWDASLRFNVAGDTAFVEGTIDGTTPGRVMQLVIEHPEVRTLVLQNLPGSMDDDSSLLACRMIRQHGFATHVPADGEIASGGVDMFMSGERRSVSPGGKLGVHSWGGVGEAGDQLPRDHEAHEMYLEFFREMDVPEAFYWFTIDAAGPEDIHWMTEVELMHYGCITDDPPQANMPVELGSYAFGLIDIPASHHRLRREGFTKQTKIVAPNGKPIRIIAQAGVPDIAVARARNLLRFFLTDVPGTRYGADKSAVANAMADNEAMLMMPTGSHQPGHEPHIDAQPLFRDETPVDGSTWYLTNDWEHRDAGFEEIFHLVHDAGIGTYIPGALPAYQRALDREARAAIADGRWGIPIDPGVGDWIAELEEEDSLAQEYIASVLDTYYGLWGAFDDAPGGMWGIYTAKTRGELSQKDPRGQQLLEDFLPPMMHGYEALIDPSFQGEFLMYFDPDHLYTHKSQYYVDATLTGTRESKLRGNAEDNVLCGNDGNNLLYGGEGTDTAVFRGPRHEYHVERDGGTIIVTDQVSDRDGTDRLIDIEAMRFADGAITAASPSHR